MKIISSRLESQYPKDDKGWTTQLVSLRAPGPRPKRPLLILLGAVGFVLLISVDVAQSLIGACRNATSRDRRASGTGREPLAVDAATLVESLLLAFVGGVIGLLMASWGVSVLVGLLPQYGAYRAPGDIHIDGTVLSSL